MQAKERKFIWVGDNAFYRDFWVHERKRGEENRD
jgi:hypothetical protein